MAGSSSQDAASPPHGVRRRRRAGRGPGDAPGRCPSLPRPQQLRRAWRSPPAGWPGHSGRRASGPPARRTHHELDLAGRQLGDRPLRALRHAVDDERLRGQPQPGEPVRARTRRRAGHRRRPPRRSAPPARSPASTPPRSRGHSAAPHRCRCPRRRPNRPAARSTPSGCCSNALAPGRRRGRSRKDLARQRSPPLPRGPSAARRSPSRPATARRRRRSRPRSAARTRRRAAVPSSNPSLRVPAHDAQRGRDRVEAPQLVDARHGDDNLVQRRRPRDVPRRGERHGGIGLRRLRVARHPLPAGPGHRRDRPVVEPDAAQRVVDRVRDDDVIADPSRDLVGQQAQALRLTEPRLSGAPSTRPRSPEPMRRSTVSPSAASSTRLVMAGVGRRGSVPPGSASTFPGKRSAVSGGGGAT